MPNAQQPFMGGFSDPNDHISHPVEVEYALMHDPVGQTRLATLIEAGFMWEEALQLLNLQENLYNNKEMRQRMSDDHRMQFARWLIEHGEISE